MLKKIASLLLSLLLCLSLLPGQARASSAPAPNELPAVTEPLDPETPEEPEPPEEPVMPLYAEEDWPTDRDIHHT